MTEEMLSHLIFSLYLAHLGPCDNVGIDSNSPVLTNSIMADIQLESTAITFMPCFYRSCSHGGSG